MHQDSSIEPTSDMTVVSVVIVNYNAGHWLIECVRSVLSADYPSVEVIVSDNGSTDGSIVMLRRYFHSDPRLHILTHHNNLGFAKANNLALPYAKGDWVLFLNPDCLIQTSTLGTMLRVLKHFPQVGMAGCVIRNPDGTEQAGCRRSIPTPWRAFVRFARLGKFARYDPRFASYVQTGQPLPLTPFSVEAISGAFMLVRRSAIEQIGLMDEEYFMHCEDLDWCMRFHRSGLDVLFVPQVEVTHIRGVCSAARPILVEYYKHKGMVRFYHKFFRYDYPSLVMWGVMIAIGIRFLFRAASFLVPYSKEVLEQQERVRTSVNLHQSDTASIPLNKQEKPPMVIVTGATSLVGDELLPQLIQSGFFVHAFSRTHPEQYQSEGIFWHRFDLSLALPSECFDAQTLIHLGPLSVLMNWLVKLGGTVPFKRIIALSSTSVFTKSQSKDEMERWTASHLQRCETELSEFCTQHNINWTLFRPTLIYRLGRDKNITTIARFIQCFGFFPLVGEGKGLRQPVHARDVANACAYSLDCPASFSKAYNLSGRDIFSYREMVEKVFFFIGKKPRFIPFSLSLARLTLKWLACLPGYQYLTPEMADRMNMNMCFDHASAHNDIGFEPSSFLEYEIVSSLS